MKQKSFDKLVNELTEHFATQLKLRPNMMKKLNKRVGKYGGYILEFSVIDQQYIGIDEGKDLSITMKVTFDPSKYWHPEEVFPRTKALNCKAPYEK